MTQLMDLVKKCRSYRRFYEDVPITRKTLEELIELTRYCASGANLQPLKYILSHEKDTNDKIFSCLGWAGYLPYWPGPEEGERPSGYIVMVNDTSISDNPGCDHGICAQTILLGAVEKGLGGCMIASVNGDKLKSLLSIDDKYRIVLVTALGKPRETVVVEPVKAGGSIKYYRDDDGTHYVPKRELGDIIIA